MNAEPVDTLPLPVRRVWTLEDLVSLPDDGHRYEIVDGSPYGVEIRLVGPGRRG
jgi:hypothetical protein